MTIESRLKQLEGHLVPVPKPVRSHVILYHEGTARDTAVRSYEENKQVTVMPEDDVVFVELVGKRIPL